MRVIRTTYSTVTPESAMHGDFADTGWVDEAGESMEPDDSDKEEGLTAVDLAVQWLERHGASNDGGSHWFTTGSYTSNYRTGEEREENFHLAGFTKDEEAAIFTRMKERT